MAIREIDAFGRGDLKGEERVKSSGEREVANEIRRTENARKE